MSEEERRRIAAAYGVSDAALKRLQEPDAVSDDAERLAATYGVRVESVRAILKKGQQENG